MLVDGGGRIVEFNARTAELLGVEHDLLRDTSTRCCDLVCARVAAPIGPIGPTCLTSRAGDRPLVPAEIEIEVGAHAVPGSAWVAAYGISNDPARILFHLRPGLPHSSPITGFEQAPSSDLKIRALGELRVETNSGLVVGDWLQQRPGELFKYLICNRSHPSPSEQIAEALWPNATQNEALTSVRQYVHQLRNALEPGRSRGTAASQVITRRGGYELDLGWLDADEFERRVERGLYALTLGRHEDARPEFAAAWELYRGDFLAEDPYAEWALVERDRLRELGSRALRALIALELDRGELELAADHARDLADMDPFDMDVHRDYLAICLRLGRRSEAVRRYGVLCDRVRRRFDEEPEFTLRELSAYAAPIGRSQSRGVARTSKLRSGFASLEQSLLLSNREAPPP